ncbi:MAG: hypothetical protein JSU68_07020 [Phycisphaerales bacterium]|nr:MAG: hypothetical protein JSU68_07020 [Phycisphaerales bacterium]
MSGESVTMPAEAQEPARPGWGAVLLAPYFAPFTPSRAGRAMSSASCIRTAAAILLCLSISWIIGLLIRVWDGTMVVGWADEVLAPVAFVPSTIYHPSGFVRTTTAPAQGKHGVIKRGLAESFRNQATGMLLTWFLWALAFGLLWVALGSLVLAWLFLPDAQSDKGSATYLRNLRAIWMVAVIAILCSKGVQAGEVYIQHAHLDRFVRGELGPHASTWFSDDLKYEDAFTLFSYSVTAVGILWCLIGGARIARGANAGPTVVESEPRCNACGYNLYHIPQSGRCPECGTPVQDSIAPESRPGLRWQSVQEGGIGTRVGVWMQTTTELLLHPSKSYRALRTRAQASAANSFIGSQLAAIVTAALLLVVFGRIGDPSWNGYSLRLGWVKGILVPCFWAVLAAWIVYRCIAALVITVCMVRRDPGATRAICAVVPYEVVTLWLFLVMNGILFLAAPLLPNVWQSSISALSRGGVPPRNIATYVLCAGNLALVLVWIWRYRVAWRAVRYANF